MSTPILAENTPKVITEDMVISTLDAWQNHANNSDVKASMALLSEDVIIEAHLPNGEKWIHYQIPRDGYEEIITKAQAEDRVYSHVREEEQIDIADDGLNADSIAIIFERENRGGKKKCTKTTEEMSFKIMDGQLKIVRMSGIVWVSC